MNLDGQCGRDDPHQKHRWRVGGTTYHCKGVEEPITVHTFDEHNWPEFTVTGNGGEVGFVRIACSDCDWVKVFDAPVSFGGLTVATVRHGMGHQEEQR